MTASENPCYDPNCYQLASMRINQIPPTPPMFPRFLCAILISHGLLAAQEPDQPESPASDEPVVSETGSDAAPDIAAQNVTATARTFIPGSLQVPPFTPPVPPPRKAVLPIRVDASVTVPITNSCTLTIQRGEPSTRPDLPEPPPPTPWVEPAEPTPEEVASQIWERRHSLSLGATIYDHKVSVVNWTDHETLVQYEAVCGFDIGLLAGVGGFVHKGENYTLILMHGHVSSSAEGRFGSQWPPKITKVAPGQIIITRGNPEDQAVTASVSVIKDIIAAEEPRLVAYQASRETYFAASAAWHAAHPPVPRDVTFILRPHRGSRYLPATQPTKP